MAIITKSELKALFETNDKPSQQDFADLIDTLLEDYHSSMTVEAHGGIISSLDIRLTDDRTPLPHGHDTYLKSETYTKAETDDRIQIVIGAAPAALDTLEEIGARLIAEESVGDALIAQIATKANSDDVYTKAQTYTRSEADAIIGFKADTADVYTKVETDGLISTKVEASSLHKSAIFSPPTIVVSTSGAITIDWGINQTYIQPEPTGAITYTFTPPAGPCHLQLFINSDGTSGVPTITFPGSVVQYGQVWVGVANKKAIINFWYDGTSYHMMGSNEV